MGGVMKIFRIIYFILFLTTGMIAKAQSPMIANITDDVETDFGTYHPYQVNFTPNVPLFTIEPDFSNVENFGYNYSEMDSILLLQNHFTVKKGIYKQLYEIYNACTWGGTPIFVTTDAVLHIYHVLFDYFLSEIEVEKFVEMLNLLNNTLLEETNNVFLQSQSTLARDAAFHNLAFLSVTKKLLNGTIAEIPDTVATLVDAELELIENHAGFDFSPILGDFSKLDYSQFQVRGHYTKNDTLTKFFKSMMWYGWTIFTMEPDLFGDLARCHTLQALLSTQMVYNLNAGDSNLFELWDNIYQTTTFFVGKTDDPNIRDYNNIAHQVYGDNFLNLSLDSLANPVLLNEFMQRAQLLPEPKIPNWIYGTFITYITYKGFRLMGQRFIPDSYMFAHLVLPEVPLRLFPKGLDIMAILGSERAFTLLDSVYQETEYLNYSGQIANFQTEFSSFPDSIWAQNLYWNWLYCLMPLLYQKGDGYPYFMQTLAWADKELLAALASWAELRHDTILYAKQSMSPPCGIPPGPPKSYVEPNPYLYARLAALVNYTREGLQSRGLLLEKFQDKLDLFETLLLFLKDVSIKELENIPLSDSEYENIFCFGKVMQDLVTVNTNPDEPWNSDADDMAVIADVHTDSNTDQCLEEGVGYPLEINVIVNEGGTIRMTTGAIFSYYEFCQPITDRLTDELWREMLTADNPPSLPEWVISFMDISAIQPAYIEDSPDNLYSHEFNFIEDHKDNHVPDEFNLYQNYPNPFNPTTTITFSIPTVQSVKISIYNILGQLVTVLLDDVMQGGKYQIRWDGRDSKGILVASGIYFVSLETKNRRAFNKMIINR
jgi:hypothetical protein